MNVALEQLKRHLDQREVEYRANDEKQYLEALLGGGVGVYRLVAHVDAEDYVVQVLGYAPLLVPEGSRPAVSEVLMRANYGMRVGKFEMDLDDGELRYHMSHMADGGELNDKVVRRLVAFPVFSLNLYLPAVMSVVYGNESPEDAVRHVEADRVQTA